ncbi:hypothetical protein OBBRIDRAFT_755279 [Obba rivulosa]|uniref:RING-type E3 ubiquitin transferase n=1 Tax=Obba rivulosa TaxID=1052685 RepID=A0A8E2ASS6_9APHY|nr:hypothetical protein OBBRIDRAFT_755279 [Obba rivulosa]
MPIHDVIRQRMQPFTAAVTSNRIFLYSVFSTFAVVGVIANACRIHSNFYSVSVYLAKSSRSVLVLANFGLLFALLCGRVIQRIFFGPLQPREVERLYDQTWMFVTESLLAFTIFRDEFDVPFVLMFGFLLFVKCFHWLVADRVESMDQTTYPGPSLLFHIRMNGLFFLLWMTDLFMFSLAVESTLSNGVGGMVLFASEYAILMASALNAIARYTLSVIDIRRARSRGGENAPPWENKSMYIFYIELVTDFLKLATYLTFFMVILTFYGLPLNIIRDVYLTARSFITRLRALVRYHNATRDMDRRYPDATEAELSAMSDRTCIICREEMVSRVAPQAGAGQDGAGDAAQAPDQQEGPNMTPKKLPCGHIFHFQCLRSWLERQQSCPTCRRPVLETTPPAQGAPQGRAAGPRAPQQGVPPQLPQRGQQGGAGGWLGRFFGAAVQPPVGPGQFAHGDFRQFMGPGAVPPQQAPNGGWAPGVPPPPYYGYPYPPPPQGPLQQPPVFRGFYGPGGVWQPWGPNPAVPAQEAQPQAQAQQPAPNAPAAGVASNESATATGGATRAQAPPPASASIATPSGHTPTSAPTLSSGSSRLASPNGQPTTPRDAAALAALRRLNPAQSQSSAPTSSAVPRSPAPPLDGAGVSAPPTSSTTSSAATTPSTIPPSASQASSSTTPTPTATNGSTTQPSRDAETRPDLPALIPLYDLGSRSAPYPTHPSMPSMYPPQYRSPQPSRAQQGGPAQSQPAAPRTSSQPASTAGQSRWARTAAAAQRAPIHQLPTTLTDVQLAHLDQLTREAIDERLRVLEGVSGAVYRCIEELTRVRSVLPPAAGTAYLQQDRTAAAAAASASARPSSTVAAPGAVTPSPSTGGSVAQNGAASPSATSVSAGQAQAASPTTDGTSKESAIVVEADETE